MQRLTYHLWTSLALAKPRADAKRVCIVLRIRHPRKVFALIVLEKGSLEASVETANCGSFSSRKMTQAEE